MTTTSYVSEEILDLVDKNDEIIGTLERSKVYAAGLNNFRVINCFIINKKGQIWIPRRTIHKKVFPLCLDVSVGGHVASGETYDEAFARELHEEACLSIKDISYKKIGALNPHEHGVSAFMHVYHINYDKTPPFNKNDFIDYYWLYPYEILERVNTIDKNRVKSDLPLLVQHFFINKD